MDIYTVLFAIINAAILLFYLYDLSKIKRAAMGLLPVAASVILGLIIISLLGELFNETTVYFVLNFAVLFSILPFYYIKKTGSILIMIS